MKEQILVSKQTEDNTYKTDYVTEVFETSNDLNLIKSVVEKAEERIYVSWASVEAIDKANEKIPIQDIIKNQKTLLKRGAPIMDSHTNMQVGKTLAFKVLQHPKTQTLGILHLNKIYDDNEKDTDVWNKIKSGEYKGSSVGGYSTNSEIGFEESKLFKTLLGFQHFETSAVKEPCNPFALNEAVSIVAKSYDTNEKQMVNQTQKEEVKKETALEQIMAKVSSGDELSESESKALSAAIDAAQSVMAEDNTPQEEEKAEESEESNEEQGMSELEKTVSQLVERMDMIEDAISGTASTAEKEDEEEEEKSEDEDEKDKTEKSNDEGESEEVAKLKQEIAELKKQLSPTKKEVKQEVKEVVKAERPAQAPKKTFTAYDIASGKAKYNPKTQQIEAK